MKTIKTWLNDLNVEKPEFSDTITKFAPHFSESGFSEMELISTLDKELKQIEINISTSLTEAANA